MVPIFGTLVHGGMPHTCYVGFSRLVVCFMVIPWWGGAETRVLGSKWVYLGLKYSKPPWTVPILGTLVHVGIPHTCYVGFSRLVVCVMVIPWLGGAETRVFGANGSNMP